MDVNSAFESAKRAAMQGNKYKARSILREIVKVQPRNEAAWLLFADIAEKPEHTIQCLKQVLKFNPNNEIAREKLAKYSHSETDPHPNKASSPNLWRTFATICVVGIVIATVYAMTRPYQSNADTRPYQPNADDAFSNAAGYAISEMYAQNPSRYGCDETENKKAAYWYEIKVSDLGNGKYYVIGAMKAIDEFCLYNTGYFAATVFYDRESKDWKLADTVYISNECMTLSHKATTSDVTDCTLWRYGWTPDMNWRPLVETSSQVDPSIQENEPTSTPTLTPTYVSPTADSTTQRIIFKDDFQDSGTTSVNWSPLGGTWIVENGVLSCVANGKYLANITMPEDFTFQLDIMGVNVIDKIIVFRAFDDSTHYGIDFRTAPYNDIVLVKSLPGNTGQIIQTAPFQNYNNTWYTIKVDVANNHIKAFVNGQQIIDFIDVSSPITGGTVGVGAMLQPGFSIVYYDNIVISSR